MTDKSKAMKELKELNKDEFYHDLYEDPNTDVELKQKIDDIYHFSREDK